MSIENSTRQNLPDASGNLPMGLRYNMGVTDGVPARRNLQKFTAENTSTFTGTTNNVVRIPVSSGMFLDLPNAVLELDFKNTTDNDINFDGSVAGIIQRLRILSVAGQEIERLDQYGQLDSVLTQYSSNLTSLVGDGALDGGAQRIQNNPKIGKLTEVPSEFDDAVVVPDGSNITGNDGTRYEMKAAFGGNFEISNQYGGRGWVQEESERIETNVQRHYTMNIRGGFFNPSSARMLPPNVGFVIEITLANGANCLVTSGTTAQYEATNWQLSVPAVQILDGTMMDRLNARLNSGVTFRGTTFHHHVNTMTGGTGKSSLAIGERSQVLKGLFSIIRNQSNVSNKLKFKLSKRTIEDVENYQFQIGSTLYPSQQVDIYTSGGTYLTQAQRFPNKGTSSINISEAYTECLRLFGGLNSSIGTCAIGVEPYGHSEAGNGAGLIAIDLSSYSDGSVSSGINTAENSLPVNLNIQRNNAGTGLTLQVDTYSVSEIMFGIDANGILMSSS